MRVDRFKSNGETDILRNHNNEDFSPSAKGMGHSQSSVLLLSIHILELIWIMKKIDLDGL